MDVVAETGDGQQAAELWKKHRPDITLMDLRMPGLDGVNAIYQIRAADPSARIIVLTTYDGDEDIYRGMRALQRPRAANKATRAENVAFMRPLLIWIWPSLLCLKSFATTPSRAARLFETLRAPAAKSPPWGTARNRHAARQIRHEPGRGLFLRIRPPAL